MLHEKKTFANAGFRFWWNVFVGGTRV